MKPLVPGDQGPLKASLRRVPDRRAMVLDMAKPVTFLLLTAVEAPALVVKMRVQVRQWFGEMRHDGAGLARYVRCTADTQRRLVRIEFLPPSGVDAQGALAANPEVFLALADAIEAAWRSLHSPDRSRA